MADSANKIFAWQLLLAAIVGVVWAVLWELPSIETGFFFDLSWGLVTGFFWSLLALVAVGLVAGLIWALVRKMRSSGGAFSEAMGANMDDLSATSMVSGLNRRLEAWNRSGVAWGIAWGVGVAFVWGVAGGLVWGFELNFAVTLIVVLLFGVVGALVITGLSNATDDLAGALGEGYGWLDGLTSSLRSTWESSGLKVFWGFTGALAWAVAGGFAAGGLGAGLVQGIVLAVVVFVAAVVAGIVGTMLKASMDAR
jgi:hypothetical protein